MTFGDKLRQLRESAGLTQDQLAEASGINLWTIRGYEQGRREPYWAVVFKLAAALNVGCEAFAECAGLAPDPPAAKTGKAKKTEPRKGK